MSVPLPFREDVNQWSVEQLAAWLQQREMPDIADIYLRKGIDGHKLITLPEGEHNVILNSLTLRERLDLLNIIKKIKNHSLNGIQKSQIQKTVTSNNRKPTLHSSVSTNRFISPHHNSLENAIAEVESSELSLPYIDETVNEDYLVPLSTGLGVVPQDVVPPARMKKNRCPSPPLPSQVKSRERNRIQDLELPKPPATYKNAHAAQYIDGIKKFAYLAPVINGDGTCNSKIENKEEFNAYEVIQEDSNGDSESRPGVDIPGPESDGKPPNLPHRNFTTQSSSPAPLVPVRTHASTNHKQLHSNRFGSLPVSDTPIQRDGRLGVTLSQPALGSSRPLLSAHNPHIVSQTGLHKPQSYKLAKSPLQSISKYPSGDSGVPRPTTNPPSAPPANQEFLKLEGSKSVPLNSLYRSLLDREYFHPVARSVVGEMLTEDGMFLVRPSTHSQHPLTLSVCNKGKVFNFVIRSRSDAKFALGTEKAGETAFVSVEEMIKFHKREPIKVEDGSLVYLKISPAK